MKTLQIQNLSVTHKKDLRPIISGLSFTLGQGDRCAIIGEEGNGKSTLLKLIADPDAAEAYVEMEGKIITGGATIGYLKQELSEEEKQMEICGYFCSSEAFLDRTPRELADIARELSLPTDFFYEDRLMGSLSGGEKVKMQLARLLCESPDILLMDEPSGDLDIEALRWLEGFISGCSCPVLYVSHDEVLLERTANMIIHLELLRRRTLPRCTVQRIGYREYVDRRLSAIDHQRQMARDEKARFDAQQERLRQLKEKVNHSLNSITRQDPHGGKMLKRKMHAVTSMEKRFQRESEQMTQMPDVEEAIMLDFAKSRLPDAKQVLDLTLDALYTPENDLLSRDIRLTVTGGEKLFIVGRNGAGKSTLLKQIASELLPRRDIRAVYMPQNYPDLLPLDKTPVEFLTKEGSRDEISEIRTFLGSVKYTPEEMEHRISDLSGGQKAKLLFIYMIRSGADVLLLDEPTRNFSPMSGPVIRSILQRFDGAVICVSHDRKLIGEVADRICTLTSQGLRPVDPDELMG